MLRVLVLSSLFPDATRPNFSIFVERQTRGLAQREDTQVQVVAPLGLPPAPLSLLPHYRPLTRLPQREKWKGLDVHRPRFLNLPATQGRFHARAMVAALTPVLRAIRRDFPFDVISAEFFFPDGVAAVALGRRLGVPVSIKARGSDIAVWARQPATRGQIVAAGQAADGLLAVSEPLRQDLIALGMPEERSQVIVTGVDFDRFGALERPAAKAALGIDHPLVLSVGALVPVKGHDLLIAAMAQVPGVHLWIAGSGPLQPALEKQIAQGGLTDRVRLLGAVPHDRLHTMLAAADVMALASQREGLANAWLEALASGTPIVIPDVGGARQVLSDAGAGSIVERTPTAFAAAIRGLLAAPPARAAVRAAAAPFTWGANSERLHAFLSRLVTQYRRG